jgi:hypothetical protein
LIGGRFDMARRYLLKDASRDQKALSSLALRGLRCLARRFMFGGCEPTVR